MEEGTEETVPEDTVGEPLEGETVSENTAEEELNADDIPVRAFFFPQVYSHGKPFLIDGKANNSMDAAYTAVDDITAYFFSR